MELQKPGSTIGHGKRTAVQSRRRSKEIEARELIDARMCAVSALIADGNNSFFGRHPVERVPRIARFDPVDAFSPRIVRYVPRRLRLRCFSKRKNVRDDAMAEAMEVGLDLFAHLRGQAPAKVGAQQRVVFVLVAEPG
jgi:hypothetical protein